MDGRDCEMGERSPSISSPLKSGSKIDKDSTDWIETEGEFETSGPKTEDTESEVSSSYSDHSFDHVLDGLPRSKSMPPTKLCATCQNMVDQLGRIDWLADDILDTGILHVRNSLSLKASAKNACSMCSAFLCTDDEKERDAIISRYTDGWKARFGEAPMPCSRVFVASNDSSGIITLFIKFHFASYPHWKNDNSRVSFRVNLRRSPEIYNKVLENIDASSNTRQSMHLIKNWLSACERLHPACKAQIPEFMPTRLIDLRGKHPKLCLGGLIEKNDRQYATLSHCWGAPEKKYQTLTKSSLESYLKKIEMKELPKTFHDAIEVCMELKIRYIWIDSLCIIQDDKEDWRRESVTMIDVYGSCLLNIAASSSTDGSQGCFFNRKDALRCRISLRISGKNDAMYDCTSHTKHPLDSLNVCPLESRGWTLQERLLSPRTVHFTREEVFWECHAKFVSEKSPFHSHPIKDQKKEQPSIGIWSKIIMNYSRRNLTYQADRFIALSGIAERIQQQTKDEYFAGMWCNNLIWQLCWKVYGHDVGRRISPPQAPTWSWASLASPTSIYERDRTQDFPLSKVLKVEKPHTKHQFGDMPNVALWLSCPPLLLAQVNTPYTMVFGGT